MVFLVKKNTKLFETYISKWKYKVSKTCKITFQGGKYFSVCFQEVMVFWVTKPLITENNEANID